MVISEVIADKRISEQKKKKKKKKWQKQTRERNYVVGDIVLYCGMPPPPPHQNKYFLEMRWFVQPKPVDVVVVVVDDNNNNRKHNGEDRKLLVPFTFCVNCRQQHNTHYHHLSFGRLRVLLCVILCLSVVVTTTMGCAFYDGPMLHKREYSTFWSIETDPHNGTLQRIERKWTNHNCVRVFIDL